MKTEPRPQLLPASLGNDPIPRSPLSRPATGRGFRALAVAGATATGVAAGTTTISASYTPADGTALTDSVTLNVTKPPSPIGIRLDNLNDSIAVGATVTYTAYLDYDNGTSTALTTGVTLTTSNGVVASVVTGGGFGFGLLQAHRPGRWHRDRHGHIHDRRDSPTPPIRNSPSRRPQRQRRPASTSRQRARRSK